MDNQKKTFAPNDKVEELRPFVDSFWEVILETSYASSFVSNESRFSSWEHYLSGGKEELIEKVLEVYGVDISDRYENPIPDILRFIAREITLEFCPHCKSFDVEMQRPGCSSMLLFPVLVFMYLRTKKGILYRCHKCRKRFRILVHGHEAPNQGMDPTLTDAF